MDTYFEFLTEKLRINFAYSSGREKALYEIKFV